MVFPEGGEVCPLNGDGLFALSGFESGLVGNFCDDIATRTIGHHKDAVRHADRFIKVVSDYNESDPSTLADIANLVLELDPREAI